MKKGKAEGWYLLQLYDPSQVELDIRVSGAPCHVFDQWFVHRKPDGIEQAVDYMVELHNYAIGGLRENQGVARAKLAREEKRVSPKEFPKYKRIAKKTIQELEERIPEHKEKIAYWDFFRPSGPEFDYTDKNGKQHNLRIVEYKNPLELDVSSTMSHINHKILAKVASDLHLEVNASAYFELVEQINNLKDLDQEYVNIRIQPSAEIMVPKEFARLLVNHPWQNHEKQMKKWVDERFEFRKKLSKDPRFAVNPYG
jgi:hypothetical protein